MRSAAGLFDRLCSADHLERAASLTVRGKRRRPDVAWFVFRRDEILSSLRCALSQRTWRPEGFDLLRIFDPKPRIIARAPVADRVVHTALVELIAPVFAPSWTDDDFACRPGFGTHRAVLRLRELMRRHRFAVHLDVRAYFASIDRGVLGHLLAHRIRDGAFLEVVARVLASGAWIYQHADVRAHMRLTHDWPPMERGLPIGASTSQLFAAHIYLNAFDHHVKRTLKVPGYLRYVDDIFLFGDQRRQLRRWRQEVGRWLWSERGLRLKHPAARILSCVGRLDALGHQIRRESHQVLPRARRRLTSRTSAALTHRRGRPIDLERSIASSAGVMLF